jgi:peptidyl-prolyl cis-trans isomerase D
MRGAAKYIWIILVIAFVGGFLLLDTSGLLGTSPVTAGTAVATVEGTDIPYVAWQNSAQGLAQQREQQLGRALDLDERAQVDEEAFEQLVMDVILRKEFARRGITVSDQEVVEAARFAPPPQFMSAPDFQTDGRFDIEKYRRFLSSSVARQQGILVQLEGYYRGEIPRQKLYAQVVADLYLSDEKLWQLYRDRTDSAAFSYVGFKASPTEQEAAAASVTDAELQAWLDAHPDLPPQPARARVSVAFLRRTVTAADSAAARARIAALRAELVGGASFDDVAKRASDDTASGAQGGALGRGGRGRFVKAFEDAAYALRPGQLSDVVTTEFGMHLIRVDERQGDTLDLRHILVRFAQTDSSASVTDRQADQLARLTGTGDRPDRLDSAAKALGIPVRTATVVEGSPASLGGDALPGLASWATTGTRVGDVSDLFDAPGGYFVARVDSLVPGGKATVADVQGELRFRFARDRAIAAAMKRAEPFAAAAKRDGLEAAAAAQGLTVQRTEGKVTRGSQVPGVGQLTEALGAAFALPVGEVSPVLRGDDGAYVLRVDARTEASRAAFEAQKAEQRQQTLNQLRDARLRDYLQQLRRSAKVSDKRKDVMASMRRLEA